jgi:protein Tex
VKVGMIIPGMVTNLTRFGAFIDIGVKQDGLVHISEISNRYITDPNEVLKLNDKVQVKVTEVDPVRKRIALSIKQASMPKAEGTSRLKAQDLKPKAQGVKLKASEQNKKEQETSMEDALLALKRKFKN